MIIFCDIDGTLCPHADGKLNHAALSENLKAVQKWRNAGHLFAVATGRGITSVRRLIPDCDQLFDFIVVDNGGYVFRSGYEPIIQNSINPALSQEITDHMAQNTAAEDYQTAYYTFDSELEHTRQSVGKIRFWFFDPAKIETSTEILRAKFGNQLKIHPERHHVKPMLPWLKSNLCAFINITSARAGKENAIRQIAQLYHIPDDSIITIGDDVNDFDMLRDFNGYAMHDSNPKLLELIPTDKQFDSVADIIDSLLAA